MITLTKDLLPKVQTKLPTAYRLVLSKFNQGLEVPEADRLQLAIEILVAVPGYKAESVANVLGLPASDADIIEEGADARAEQAKASAGNADEDDKEKINLDDIEEPAAVNQSTWEKYEAKYGWQKRNTLDCDFSGASDNVLAQIAIDCLSATQIMKVRKPESFYIWNGCRWKEAGIGDVRNALKEILPCFRNDRASLQHAWKNDRSKVLTAFNCADEDQAKKRILSEIKALYKLSARLSSLAGMTAVATLIGDALTVDIDQLDNNVDQVVFRNVTWDAVTDKFTPNDPKQLATRCIEIDWAEPSKEARQRFQDIIAQFKFEEDTVKFLQKSFGYSCLGRGNQKRYFWFRGAKDTGKSTLIQLVAKCLGRYTECTQSETWCSKGNARQGHSDDIAALRGARFVFADEFSESSRLDDSLLKRVTGGFIPLRASAKGQSGFTFRVPFALFFASNFDAKTSRDDAANIDRLTVLTFEHPLLNPDRDFEKKYLADVDNQRAILEWVMAGARAYIAEGLSVEPRQISDSREAFTDSQIDLHQQIIQVLVPEPDAKATNTQIKVALRELQKLTGEHRPIPNSAKEFNKFIQEAMARLDINAKHSRNGKTNEYSWTGLKVKMPTQEPKVVIHKHYNSSRANDNSRYEEETAF